MLLPYTTHVYYGKAAGAVVDEVATEEALASKQWSTAGYSDQVAVIDQAKATELIGQAFSDQVTVDTVSSAKQVSTAGVVDSIGASPSEYDIAQAVWLTILASVNYPNTMGEALGNAGAAGDPWTVDIVAGGYTGNQAGKKLKDASDDAFAASVKP
jgi:hypothetical protein